MRQTCVLMRLVSTKHGMRRILKVIPRVDDYIRQAVKAGTYLGPDEDRSVLTQRGSNNRRHRPYPVEYKILTLNPPFPTKPKMNKRDLRPLKVPGKDLVEKYLKRQENLNKQKDGSTLPFLHHSVDASVDDYYRKLLGIPSAPTTTNSTIMGQKSTYINKAYAFAMKQYEVLQTNNYNDDIHAKQITEEESFKIVEDLLAQDAKQERQQSRLIQQHVQQWRNQNEYHTTKTDTDTDIHIDTDIDIDIDIDIDNDIDNHNDIDTNTPKMQTLDEILGAPTTDDQNNNDNNNNNNNNNNNKDDNSTSIPSMFHSKERTIKAMSIWSKRLESVPYNQWTIGATVALDHWIARSILELSEQTWDNLLDGGLGPNPTNDTTTASVHNKITTIASLKAIAADIVMTRQALFPETIIDQDEQQQPDEIIDDDQFTQTEQQSTEDAIDQLLASLGSVDNNDHNNDDSASNATGITPQKQAFTWNTDDDNDDHHASENDDQVQRFVDQLQEWRRRHHEETPYESWTAEIKKDFRHWLEDYISFFESDDNYDQIDLKSTREALLAPKPISKPESDDIWDSIRDTTQAEIFLSSLSSNPPADSDMAAFWELPYQEQLTKLVNLGNLKPILDEYVSEKDRLEFLERHAHKLLDGLELEHLIDDPNGPIHSKDIPTALKKGQVKEGQRFRLEKLPYGSHQFDAPQAQQARKIFRAWNAHKAGRARYEEALFQQGKLGLRYGDPVEQNDDDNNDGK